MSTFLIFLDQGVLVKTEKRGMQGLELPAVTICPRFSSSRQAKIVFSYFPLKQSLSRGPGASGWRNGNTKSTFWDVLQHQCAEYPEDATEVKHKSLGTF